MKTLKIFFLLSTSFLFGAFVSSTIGIDPVVGGLTFTGGQSLLSKYIFADSGIAYAVGLDLSAFNTALGAYCRKFDAQIMNAFFKGLEFEKYMTPIAGISDEYVSKSAEISEILQPYQKAYTPKGTITPNARINKVRQVKIDYTFEDLNELHTSWLCELADESIDRRQWPFVRYAVSKLIIPKMIEEMDYNSWNGNYAAPTPSTAGDSVDTVDGIGTIIADEITATNITPVTVGALSPTNMVDKVELFVDSIANAHSNWATPVFMSKTNAKYYWRDYRANFGANNNYDGKANTKIDATNKMIVGLDCMEGSDRFLHTNPGNLIKMFDKVEQLGNLQSQLDKREVILLGDFKRGYGFKRLDTVYVSDQA